MIVVLALINRWIKFGDIVSNKNKMLGEIQVKVCINNHLYKIFCC